MGRKTKYNKEMNVLVKEYAERGLSDSEIAHNLGINYTYIYEWIKKYPEFSKALKEGKRVIDEKVENALLKKATGYEYEEIETIATAEKRGKEVENITPIRIRKIKRQIAPDTTAQIFWLTNRKRDDWKHVRQIEMSGKVEHEHYKYEEYTKEQLKEEAKKIAEELEQIANAGIDKKS